MSPLCVWFNCNAFLFVDSFLSVLAHSSFLLAHLVLNMMKFSWKLLPFVIIKKKVTSVNMMHENDHTVVSLIVTKHVFIISSRQAILTKPCTFYETTSLNTVTEGWCLSCLSTVPYTWWTLSGKKNQ